MRTFILNLVCRAVIGLSLIAGLCWCGDADARGRFRGHCHGRIFHRHHRQNCDIGCQACEQTTGPAARKMPKAK